MFNKNLVDKHKLKMLNIESRANVFQQNFKKSDRCSFFRVCILDNLNQALETKVLFSESHSSSIDFNSLIKPMLLNIVKQNKDVEMYSDFIKKNDIFSKEKILVESAKANIRHLGGYVNKPSEYYMLVKTLDSVKLSKAKKPVDFVRFFGNYKIECIEIENEELKKPYIEASIKRIKKEVDSFFKETITSLSEIHNIEECVVELILQERIENIKTKYSDFYHFTCKNYISDEVKEWNKILHKYSEEKEQEQTLITNS